MIELLSSLQNLLIAAWDVILSLLALILPWTPLLCWVAFWLLAVNWVKLYDTLMKGGFFGVAFIGLMSVLIWGVVAPPEDGKHEFFEFLRVGNVVGKTVYVTTLIVIMFVCGSVQLSGACEPWATFPPDTVCEEHCHGHDSHDGHAHDHGHDHDTHGDHGHGHGHGHHDHGHGHH